MTVIAVRKTKSSIHLACDNQITYGDRYKKTDAKDQMYSMKSKLFQVNDLTVGAAGMVQGACLFEHFCGTRKPASSEERDILQFMVEFSEWARTKDTTYTVQDSHFILIFENKVFEIQGLLVRQVEEFDAIGSGSFLALSALYFGKTVEQAVEVAKQFDLFCGGDTKSLTINF